jgi:hypothetical protein
VKVVGKNTSTTSSNISVISDMVSETNGIFYGDSSADSTEDCDALYLEAFSDSDCSVALSTSQV